ncbi:MAG TPA: protein kinase, partial [Polyangiaceae bacterium]
MNTFGRYQLVASLGRGRLTEAFKAKSFGIEGFEKTLVVKCVHPELAQDQAFAQAFVGEAKLAVRLSHANIVQVFDAGCVEEDGRSTYFLATEHVAGLTLRSIWERCGFQPLPVHLCLHVASELAKALDHAHRRSDNRHKPLGIVHANLSPDNVFLSWNGDVKVSDFCLARALARLPHRLPEHDGPHLSPEQRLGQAALAQSDVFALGSMLYRLLTGQNPFVPGSSEEVLQQIERTDFTRSGLPRELRELVERALAFPADERFESASQFHESLLMTSYASPKRFSSQDLAEFVERFREPPSDSAETAGSVLAGPNLQSVPPPSMHVDAGSGRARSWPPLADMRDLTVLSLRLGNVPVPAAMRKRAKQIVERYGGHILAESSRELDAAFGLERTDARDTESAARSALVLVRMLGSAESEPSAGIDSGRLRAGAEGPFREGGAGDELLGSARRLAHLVPGRVAVSESVAVNLRTAFGSEPVPAESAARLLQDTHAPPLGRFVGRHSELSELGQRLLEAGRGKVQVVGLVGEQGIGKTRLLLEIERRIKKSGLNIGFYCASCPPCGSQTLEGALLPMLRTLCSVRESDSAARLGAIEPSLRALGLRDEEVDALLAELGASPMGAGLSDRAPLRAAVRRMLLRLSEDRPHIFAWDDAQEMDADSASLLSSFVERLGHAPAMLLLSARPGGAAHYRSIVGYSEFPLHLLPEHDVRRLIAQELGVDKVPDRLFYFIQERAAGNPMFIVELLTEAKQSGAIVIEGGRVELSRL